MTFLLGAGTVGTKREEQAKKKASKKLKAHDQSDGVFMDDHRDKGESSTSFNAQILEAIRGQPKTSVALQERETAKLRHQHMIAVQTQLALGTSKRAMGKDDDDYPDACDDYAGARARSAALAQELEKAEKKETHMKRAAEDDLVNRQAIVDRDMQKRTASKDSVDVLGSSPEENVDIVDAAANKKSLDSEFGEAAGDSQLCTSGASSPQCDRD